MANAGFVDIYKRVRKSKAWNEYQMSKSLRINQTQLRHYEGNPISTREILLVKLHELSGMSLQEFWEMLKEEALNEDKKRRKKIIDRMP